MSPAKNGSESLSTKMNNLYNNTYEPSLSHDEIVAYLRGYDYVVVNDFPRVAVLLTKEKSKQQLRNECLQKTIINMNLTFLEGYLDFFKELTNTDLVDHALSAAVNANSHLGFVGLRRVMKVLLTRNANLNMFMNTKFQPSVLCYAAMTNRYDAVTVLAENGANSKAALDRAVSSYLGTGPKTEDKMMINDLRKMFLALQHVGVNIDRKSTEGETILWQLINLGKRKYH